MANIEYYVVVNGEEQFSIWPSFKSVPPGWVVVGDAGTREECLEYIDKNWQDIKPRSLREQLKTA